MSTSNLQFTMTSTNDDIMSFLRKLKIQADKNSEEVKNQVKIKIDELSEKVDNVQREASEKEKRNKDKMDSVNTRLAKIEEQLIAAKDKCEERETLAKEQFERSDKFRESMGLKRVSR